MLTLRENIYSFKFKMYNIKTNKSSTYCIHFNRTNHRVQRVPMFYVSVQLSKIKIQSTDDSQKFRFTKIFMLLYYYIVLIIHYDTHDNNNMLFDYLFVTIFTCMKF